MTIWLMKIAAGIETLVGEVIARVVFPLIVVVQKSWTRLRDAVARTRFGKWLDRR